MAEETKGVRVVNAPLVERLEAVARLHREPNLAQYDVEIDASGVADLLDEAATALRIQSGAAQPLVDNGVEVMARIVLRDGEVIHEPVAAAQPGRVLPLGHPVRKQVEEIAYNLAYDARQEAVVDDKYPKLTELSLNAAQEIITLLLGSPTPVPAVDAEWDALLVALRRRVAQIRAEAALSQRPSGYLDAKAQAAGEMLDIVDAHVLGRSPSVREPEAPHHIVHKLLDIAYSLRTEYDVGDSEFGCQNNDAPEELTAAIVELEQMAKPEYFGPVAPPTSVQQDGPSVEGDAAPAWTKLRELRSDGWAMRQVALALRDGFETDEDYAAATETLAALRTTEAPEQGDADIPRGCSYCGAPLKWVECTNCGSYELSTEAPVTSAWLAVDGAQSLKQCPQCEFVALEGQTECDNCGAKPQDDQTWRAPVTQEEA